MAIIYKVAKAEVINLREVEKCRLLLPGACEPRLNRLRPRTLISVYRAALSSESNRSIVVIGNYKMARNVGTISGKSTPFTPSSILFRPQHRPRGSAAVHGGGAGYRPRVRWVYYDGRLSP